MYLWPDGSQYNGKFYMGKREGIGTMTYADGRTFQVGSNIVFCKLLMLLTKNEMQNEMQSVQRLHSTNSDQRIDNLARWHGVYTVLSATHTLFHEWNEPSCIHFVSIHQMALPEQGGAHLDQLTTHLSNSKG